MHSSRSCNKSKMTQKKEKKIDVRFNHKLIFVRSGGKNSKIICWKHATELINQLMDLSLGLLQIKRCFMYVQPVPPHISPN